MSTLKKQAYQQKCERIRQVADGLTSRMIAERFNVSIPSIPKILGDEFAREGDVRGAPWRRKTKGVN